MKKNIIFGAGQIGRVALETIGEENIAFFIDNNELLWGTHIRSIEVKPVDALLKVHNDEYRILVASKYYESMSNQLNKMGIKEFDIFEEYYANDAIVINPYEDNNMRDISEDEWNNRDMSAIYRAINDEVEKWKDGDKIFDRIEIETINRCNGECDFCPVNRNSDPRELHIMSDELFERIIAQLEELNYSGHLALFCNNEPFVDKKIIERHRYAREKLPHAKINMYTNGTLLTVEKFQEIIDYLDELVIDNYNENLELNETSKLILNYCEKHPEYKKKVTIVLRNPHEVLSTRGGDAPNRHKMISYGDVKCPLPFKQMIVRPDGKVSLCCNDPLGKNTLGDLEKNSILEVWTSQKFKTVRRCLEQGRREWKHCMYCDFFSVGE